MLKDKLLQLGFSSNQADVYIALSTIGQSKVGLLLIKTGLHRYLVYQALQQLVERKMVYKIEKSGVAYYAITDPKIIINESKRNEELAREVAAELSSSRTDNPEIFTLTDVQGIKDYLDMLLDSKEDILIIGVDYYLQTKYKDIYQQFQERLLRKKIKRLILTYEENRGYEKLMENSETKYFPSSTIKSPIVINIFNDMVAQILYREPMVIIIVRHKKMAEEYKSYFKLLWEQAKK